MVTLGRDSAWLALSSIWSNFDMFVLPYVARFVDMILSVGVIEQTSVLAQMHFTLLVLFFVQIRFCTSQRIVMISTIR
jgi:hypothetical protein